MSARTGAASRLVPLCLGLVGLGACAAPPRTRGLVDLASPDGPPPDEGPPPEQLDGGRLPSPVRAALLAQLRANVVLGMVEAGRWLRRRPGRQALVLEGPFADEAQRGVPPAFAPWFRRWQQLRLTEDAGGELGLELVFADWVKALHLSTGSISLHDVDLYLSRARRVTGRLVVDRLDDPRARASAPYAEVRRAPDTVIVEADESEPFPGGHPFLDRARRPVGVDRLDGFSLQATTDGFWQTTFELLPVERIFVFEDDPRRDVWISYLDVAELEQELEDVLAPDVDPAFDERAAFPDYRRRRPREDDVLGFFNMSANSRHAPPGWRPRNEKPPAPTPGE